MTSVTGQGGRRIGLLGGTFDPPHIGHLLAAVAAHDQLGLDTVYVIPNGDPWQKSGRRRITAATVRLAMVRAAVAGLDGVEASDVEVLRPGPSYTIDTVGSLRQAEPDVEVTLLLGRDAEALLSTWHRIDELLGQVGLAVVDRSGVGAQPAPATPTAAPTPVAVAMPRVDVSSSDLRRRVAEGRPLAVLTPPAVIAIVDQLHLYRG